MLAAGASERDGHIVLVFLRITFDGDGDGFLVGVKELLRALAGEHVVADRFVLARQRTKLRHPERVGKEPDVRHEIGVYRNAVFESETEDMHGNRGRSGTKQTLVQFRGQLMDAQCRGVDDDVGVLFEVLQQVAFLKDAVDQTIALLQRMGPAHGFVALDEHLVAGVEEQDAGLHPKIVQMAQHGGQVVEIVT